MYTLLVVISTIVAVFLILIVLMQSSKGGGLAGTFGGGGGMGTMFGTRRTADFLSKATWWLAGSSYCTCSYNVTFSFYPVLQQAVRERV
jgi:preprotein translocase subunit SecG